MILNYHGSYESFDNIWQYACNKENRAGSVNEIIDDNDPDDELKSMN